MKKLLIPILIISGFFAFYEQTKPQPNLYISGPCIVIFMIGLMVLGNKIPSKNHDNDDNIL